MKKISFIVLSFFIILKCVASYATEGLSEYQSLEKISHLERKLLEIEQIKLEKKFDSGLVDFRLKQMDHNVTILKWQHYSGIGIFFLVVFLVLGGFYLSYLQFKRDEKTGISSGATIEAGKSGIKFSSSVIGLVILFMSFAFFYLYIIEVYTIWSVEGKLTGSQVKVRV